MKLQSYEEEFDRQSANLINKGYPGLAGMDEKEFIKILTPLKKRFSIQDFKLPDFESGYLPFVIVVKSGLVPSEKMMQALEFNSKEGITKLIPHVPSDFQTIAGMGIPESSVYLIVDIDRGKESINVTPETALDMIKMKHGFPLTIDEGIATVTQFPEFLVKNNCFSLLASRTGKDQRVPAIWINSAKQANLGWCWDRNPHTWLGSASCKLRI